MIDVTKSEDSQTFIYRYLWWCNWTSAFPQCINNCLMVYTC